MAIRYAQEVDVHIAFESHGEFKVTFWYWFLIERLDRTNCNEEAYQHSPARCGRVCAIFHVS